MKPEELRIGNWFNWDGNNPTQLTLGHFQDMLLYIYDRRKYQPIPLTEEWLEEFGFDKNEFGGEYWYELEFENRYKLITNDSFFNNGKDEFQVHIQAEDDDLTNNFVKHVHQLQNLYYALTGEELECNQ